MRTSSSGDDLAQPTPSSSAEDLSRLIEAQQALRALQNNGSLASSNGSGSSVRVRAGSLVQGGRVGAMSSPRTASVVGGGAAHGADGSLPLGAPPQPRQRLLVVANRLPVSAERRPDGGWKLTGNAGGLVSALMGVRDNYDTTWIGHPGVEVSDPVEQRKLTAALASKGCLPVFVDARTYELYYNGYSNNVLWPLFHYIPLPTHEKLDAAQTARSQWSAYQRANRLFSRAVLTVYREGDVVWCHDYHLCMLPQYLKEMRPSMKVGWFLHTPFPSSEIFRTLPLRSEILRGVLHADLTGFHTYDYARHFVSACTRILGLEGTPAGVEDNGRVIRVCAFPIGIDPERFWQTLRTEPVRQHVHMLRERFAGKKVMLGVDRLDVIKGIPQKLLAFEKFLEENPEWRSRVLLVQIAVPTRVDVPEYKALRSQVHEIVGRVNGRFGTLDSVPIHHLDRSMPFHELCALYAVTDLALVTSLRDGMNLVSYEYVACHTGSKKGVLMLSEFAGAAQSLGAGAILVNPWDVTDMSHGIKEALTMSEEEREERHRHNFAHVVAHTAQAWADNFVSELNDTHVEEQLRTASYTMPLPYNEAVDAFSGAKRRLVLIGYNGTLTTSSMEQRDGKRRYDTVKGRTRMHPAAKELLSRLAADPCTTVLVFTGSERHTIEDLMGDLPVWLAAENGVFLRPPERGAVWRAIHHPSTLNLGWIESVQMVMDYFCERTPRSTVHTRETSIVWSYKHSDPEFGRAQARDMLQHLWTGPISNSAVDVFQGARSVEVRPVGISKGIALEKILSEIAPHLHEGDKSVHGPEDGAQMGAESAPQSACPRTSLFDYVFVMGHFLSKDEDLFSYFECDATEASPASAAAEAGDLGAASADPPSPPRPLAALDAQMAASLAPSTGDVPASAEAGELAADGAAPKSMASSSSSAYDISLSNGEPEAQPSEGGGAYSIVKIRGKDRSELLRDLTTAMGRLGFSVHKALINTEGAEVLNEFRVSYHGRQISEDEWPMVKMELLTACTSTGDDQANGATAERAAALLGRRRMTWRTDLFGPAPKLYTVTVGRRTSLGKYYVGNSEDALAVLQAFAEIVDGADDVEQSVMSKKLSFGVLNKWWDGSKDGSSSDGGGDVGSGDETGSAVSHRNSVDSWDGRNGPLVGFDGLSGRTGTAALAAVRGENSFGIGVPPVVGSEAEGTLPPFTLPATAPGGGEASPAKPAAGADKVGAAGRALNGGVERLRAEGASAVPPSPAPSNYHAQMAPSPGSPLPKASAALSVPGVVGAPGTPSSSAAVASMRPKPSPSARTPSKKGFWHNLKGGPRGGKKQ